jgi:hypothetical protein
VEAPCSSAGFLPNVLDEFGHVVDFHHRNQVQFAAVLPGERKRKLERLERGR